MPKNIPLIADGSRQMNPQEIADAARAAEMAEFGAKLETTIAAQSPRIQQKVAALLAERQAQAESKGGGFGQHA